MGDAKRRGTRGQRVQQAEEVNLIKSEQARAEAHAKDRQRRLERESVALTSTATRVGHLDSGRRTARNSMLLAAALAMAASTSFYS